MGYLRTRQRRAALQTAAPSESYHQKSSSAGGKRRDIFGVLEHVPIGDPDTCRYTTRHHDQLMPQGAVERGQRASRSSGVGAFNHASMIASTKGLASPAGLNRLNSAVSDP